MHLHLVDLNADVVAVWGEAFQPLPEVRVHQADLLAVAENTVVSPANSLGYRDGGIDRAYLDFFGQERE